MHRILYGLTTAVLLLASSSVRADSALGVVGAPDSSGAGYMVLSVAPNTAADQMGLQAGDVITNVNGQAVRTASDIASVLQLSGAQVSVAWLRNGASMLGTATLVQGTSAAHVKASTLTAHAKKASLTKKASLVKKAAMVKHPATHVHR